MKIDSRKIDLEFKQMGQNLEELNNILADCGIKEKAIRTLKGRSKSASIQFEIPEEYGLSFNIPFYEQEQEASYWIETTIKLVNIAVVLRQHNIKVLYKYQYSNNIGIVKRHRHSLKECLCLFYKTFTI